MMWFLIILIICFIIVVIMGVDKDLIDSLARDEAGTILGKSIKSDEDVKKDIDKKLKKYINK